MRNKLLLGVINVILMITFFACIFVINLKLEVIDTNWLLILFVVLFFVTLLLYLSKNVILYNINQFFVTMVNCILLFFIISIAHEYHYSAFESYHDVGVFVLKNNVYGDISQLENKNIGLFVSNDKDVIYYLDHKMDANYQIYHNLDDLLYDINNGYIQSFVMDDSSFKLLNELDSNKGNMYHQIYNVKVKNNVTL